MGSSKTAIDPGLVQALVSEGPDPAYAEKLMTFGRLVGEWDFDWTGIDADGHVQRARGEWLFAWGLNGRAVMDVWINPSREERRTVDDRPGEWGLTVRFYDPSIDAWRVTWSGPAYGNVRSFIATPSQDGIVMAGRDDQGRKVQWVFSEMQPDSFRWRSLVWSEDNEDGDLREEMFVRRRIAPTSPDAQVRP